MQAVFFGTPPAELIPAFIGLSGQVNGEITWEYVSGGTNTASGIAFITGSVNDFTIWTEFEIGNENYVIISSGTLIPGANWWEDEMSFETLIVKTEGTYAGKWSLMTGTANPIP